MFSPIWHAIACNTAVKTVEHKSEYELMTDTPYLAPTGVSILQKVNHVVMAYEYVGENGL